MSVCNLVTYISSRSFDAKKKIIGALNGGKFFSRFLNFCLGAEILNFAVFSLIFYARKKIISALYRVIPCEDFSTRAEILNF